MGLVKSGKRLVIIYGFWKLCSLGTVGFKCGIRYSRSLYSFKQVKTLVGICDSLLDWFESYFTARSFSVELGQSHSAPASVTGGVTQGSILGPI